MEQWGIGPLYMFLCMKWFSMPFNQPFNTVNHYFRFIHPPLLTSIWQKLNLGICNTSAPPSFIHWFVDKLVWLLVRLIGLKIKTIVFAFNICPPHQINKHRSWISWVEQTATRRVVLDSTLLLEKLWISHIFKHLSRRVWKDKWAHIKKPMYCFYHL